MFRDPSGFLRAVHQQLQDRQRFVAKTMSLLLCRAIVYRLHRRCSHPASSRSGSTRDRYKPSISKDDQSFACSPLIAGSAERSSAGKEGIVLQAAAGCLTQELPRSFRPPTLGSGDNVEARAGSLRLAYPNADYLKDALEDLAVHRGFHPGCCPGEHSTVRSGYCGDLHEATTKSGRLRVVFFVSEIGPPSVAKIRSCEDEPDGQTRL